MTDELCCCRPNLVLVDERSVKKSSLKRRRRPRRNLPSDSLSWRRYPITEVAGKLLDDDAGKYVAPQRRYD